VLLKVNSLRNAGFTTRLAFEAEDLFFLFTLRTTARLFHYLSQLKVSDGLEGKCGGKTALTEAVVKVRDPSNCHALLTDNESKLCFALTA
jgi:hypothetical protein